MTELKSKTDLSRVHLEGRSITMLSPNIAPPTNDQCELGDGPADNAVQIAHYKFVFDVDPDSGELLFGTSPDSQVYDTDDIDSFIRGLINGKLPPSRLHSLAFGITHQTSLDFWVYKPCYVVLELDRTRNWRFQPSRSAVTTKEDHQDDYCCLVHVTRDAAGDVIFTPKSAPADQRCNIIYFSAVDPKMASLNVCDGANLYVEFFQDIDKVLPIMVDPDIKNGGPQ